DAHPGQPFPQEKKRRQNADLAAEDPPFAATAAAEVLRALAGDPDFMLSHFGSALSICSQSIWRSSDETGTPAACAPARNQWSECPAPGPGGRTESSPGPPC